MMTPSLAVAAKEIRDHARDVRSLLSSELMALMGPAVVFLVSLSDRARGPEGATVLLGMLSVFALVSAFATATAAATFRARPLRPGPFFGRVVLYGVVTGIAAGIVSALIVAYVFSGITGSGSAAIVAFYLKLGFTLEAASLLAGLTVEPFDKTLQVLLAALLYHATPRDFLAMLAPMPTAEAR